MSEARYEEEADDQEEYEDSYLSAEARAYQRTRSVRRVIKFFIVFVLFASAAGFAVYAWAVKDRMQADMQVFDDRGADFAKDFLAELQAEHYDRAYEQVSSDYKGRMSERQFEEFARKRQDLLKDPFTTHKFKSMQGSLAVFGKKVTAVYEGSRKTAAGKTEKVLITILRENGELKVDDLATVP
jgi:hypothetical protein